MFKVAELRDLFNKGKKLFNKHIVFTFHEIHINFK